MIGLILAASLVVTPPKDAGINTFVVPQANIELCIRNGRIWSLEWRRTEFLCVPNDAIESKDWYPVTIGPREPPKTTETPVVKED